MLSFSRFVERSSIPRLGLSKSTGGVGYRRHTGGGFVRRQGPGGGGTLRSRRRTMHAWPSFVQRRGCSLPISDDCAQLLVTPRWAVACFKPAYHQLRLRHGNNYQAIVDDLMVRELPTCAFDRPSTGAERELRRRIALAVAVLLNSEGVPVRYPPEAVFPRPARANRISQPWMRALLTGWV